MIGIRRKAGFIMVEVLIGTVLLSVGLCSVVVFFAQMQRSQYVMDGIESSAYVAQDTFETIRSRCSGGWTLDRLMQQAGSGQIQRGGLSYDRVVTFRVRHDLDSIGRLIEATVCISWNEGGNRQEKSFVTYYAVDTGIGNMR